MTEKYFQLQRCSLIGIVWELAMYFLVNSSHRISVPHFKFSKILIFGVEPLKKIRDCLLGFFDVFELLIKPIELNAYICFHLSNYFEQFRMPFLVLAIVTYHVFVDEVEEDFVKIELKSKQQERGKKIM